MSLEIKAVHFVAHWTWDVGDGDDTCGICRNPFDACCPACKVPGDDCPIVRGKCSHRFHMHCIHKWTDSSQDRAAAEGRPAGNTSQCPMCRAEWEYES